MKFSGVAKPLILLISFGVSLRILLQIFTSVLMGGEKVFPWYFFSGIAYDLSFFSIVFLIYFLLSLKISERILRPAFFAILITWLLLNAIDIFSLQYTGLRAGVYSLNLFSFQDISDKLQSSKVIFQFFLFLLITGFVLFKYRKFVLPSFPETSKHQLFTAALLFIGTLLYLPYPINYYNDQLPIKKAQKQLAVNPFFSWISSALQNNNEYLMEPAKALAEFRKQQNIPVSASGTNTIQRHVHYTDSAYDNIVLIVMESFGANRIGALGGRKKISPRFDSLCNEGVLYSRCFATGPRTQYGLSSLLYGFPHLLGYNLFRENKLKLPFQGLPSLLLKQGYNTHFIHGGSADYDDMRLFLKSDASPFIRDADNITKYKFKNNWGIDDESLFNYSSDYIGKTNGKNLFCILTMSNHEPYERPKDYIATMPTSDFIEREKGFLYSDYALGKFISDLKNKKIYEQTLIIITADHGEHYTVEDEPTKLFHVPLLIIDHRLKGIDSSICSHADIAEYILKKVGFKGKSHLIGTGLTGGPKNAYYRNYQDDICRVTDSVIYRYNLHLGEVSKIRCDKLMYEKTSLTVPPGSTEHKLLLQQVRPYYTSLKYLFEYGLYRSE